MILERNVSRAKKWVIAPHLYWPRRIINELCDMIFDGYSDGVKILL